MMCDKCGKNPATTHLKTVINGSVKEDHLCSFCAAEIGYTNFGSMSLPNMLATVFGKTATNTLGVSQKRCECCGASFSDIAQTGRMGCSECYSTFKTELTPTLNRLHGKAVYVGNAPKKDNVKIKITEKLAELKDELRKAITAEEFEKAAELRDEIHRLEGEDNA